MSTQEHEQHTLADRAEGREFVEAAVSIFRLLHYDAEVQAEVGNFFRSLHAELQQNRALVSLAVYDGVERAVGRMVARFGEALASLDPGDGELLAIPVESPADRGGRHSPARRKKPSEKAPVPARKSGDCRRCGEHSDDLPARGPYSGVCTTCRRNTANGAGELSQELLAAARNGK